MRNLLRLCIVILGLMSLPSFAATYVNLEPEFVVNYGDARKVRYLKCEITLRVKDESAVTEINHHADYIRHALVLLLSAQTQTSMGSADGREALRQAALEAIQKIMLRESGQVLVDQVLFTNFFIQK